MTMFESSTVNVLPVADTTHEYTRTGRVESPTYVQPRAIGLTDECSRRFMELFCLEEDWHEDGIVRPAMASVALSLMFLADEPQLRNQVRVYPTYEGGILLEYRFDGWDYALRFLNEGSIEFYGIEIDGPDEIGVLEFNGMNQAFREAISNRIPA